MGSRESWGQQHSHFKSAPKQHPFGELMHNSSYSLISIRVKQPDFVAFKL